jgi:hypothetical protein
MESFVNRENVLRLISEAGEHATQLGGTYKNALLPDFIQAQETLATSTDFRSHMLLIISAARLMITQAEKKTVRLIVGDDPITGQEMSHLVRIRLICAELISLLSNTLQSVKQSPAKGRPA